jgi:DNA-binding NarL/FixJ family response regulator
MPIRVLIADDNESVRQALTHTLAAEPEFELVGAAKDADEAIELARQHKPDVALLDVRMPGGGGQRAATGIGRASPQTVLVALSAKAEAESIVDMFEHGVPEYVAKGATTAEVKDALRRAAQRSTGTAQSSS